MSMYCIRQCNTLHNLSLYKKFSGLGCWSLEIRAEARSTWRTLHPPNGTVSNIWNPSRVESKVLATHVGSIIAIENTFCNDNNKENETR